MLKKFVSSILLTAILVGCGGSSSNSPAPTQESAQAPQETKEATETKDTSKEQAEVKKISKQIVSDLNLGDAVAEVKDRIIPGIFFFEEGAVNASSFYVADKKADCVGVFRVNDEESCRECIKTYLETLKAQLQTYAPDEIFKVDNAIVEAKDGLVILVVCDDIENAKNVVNSALNK